MKTEIIDDVLYINIDGVEVSAPMKDIQEDFLYWVGMNYPDRIAVEKHHCEKYIEKLLESYESNNDNR